MKSMSILLIINYKKKRKENIVSIDFRQAQKMSGAPQSWAQAPVDFFSKWWARAQARAQFFWMSATASAPFFNERTNALLIGEKNDNNNKPTHRTAITTSLIRLDSRSFEQSIRLSVCIRIDLLTFSFDSNHIYICNRICMTRELWFLKIRFVLYYLKCISNFTFNKSSSWNTLKQFDLLYPSKKFIRINQRFL